MAAAAGRAGQPHRLAFTDWGFVHASTDGGKVWDALYVRASERNPVGAALPATSSWQSNGLMDTSVWGVGWTDSADTMFAWDTDIRGSISNDGGRTFSFNYTGHPLNTMYHTVWEKNSGTLYGATSGVHDMYQSTHLTDAILDAKGPNIGRVIASQDGGSSFSVVFDFEMPVVWVALDLTRRNRLYASVVNSVLGGIYVADSLDGSSPARFQRLSSPPRTQGHPYSIVSLPDGALVVSYSGRMDNHRKTFYNSSGVFYLPASKNKTPIVPAWHLQLTLSELSSQTVAARRGRLPERHQQPLRMGGSQQPCDDLLDEGRGSRSPGREWKHVVCLCVYRVGADATRWQSKPWWAVPHDGSRSHLVAAA